MNNKSYVVINENDTYIGCYGHYNDFYKALGKLYCKYLDNVNCLVKDGYKVLKRKEYYELEADSGYGWSVEVINEENNYKFTEYWYLLIVEQYDD